MTTLSNEQVEAKKQQLKQLAGEVKQLTDELVEAGAWPLSDDDLDKAAGGGFHPFNPSDYTPVDPHKPVVPEEPDPFGRGAAEDFMKKHPEFF